MSLTRPRLLAFVVLVVFLAIAIAYRLFPSNDVPINESL